MTKKEYQAKRQREKEKLHAKIKISFQKHYKKELKTPFWMAKVMKECNASRVTVYEAVRGLIK